MTAPLVVFGDAIADYYLQGSVTRISPEAPVPVMVSNDDASLSLGGALNVAANAAALGAQVALVAAVGDDAAGRALAARLSDLGIDTADLLMQPGVTTITKTRYLARGQHLARMDREAGANHYGSCARGVTEALQRALSKNQDAMVLVSDYGKGTVADSHLTHLAGDCSRNRKVIVDPSGPSIERYKGLWGLKANRAEAEALLGERLSDRVSLGAGVHRLRELGFSAVWITLGDEGSVFLAADGDVHWQASRARSVFDITGAGDTFLAALGVALTQNREMAAATAFANAASGIAVERMGTSVVQHHELAGALRATALGADGDWRSRYLEPAQAAEEAERCRDLGLRVGFSNGCFDLLHAGHIDSLEYAAEQIDVLFVGLNSDESVSRAKGPGRPIQTCELRARALLGLRAVDYVVPFEETTPEKLIRSLRPDILFKGEDWAHFVAGGDFVESYGGKVRLVPLTPGLSTSDLVTRIRSSSDDAPTT
jgi:D-beta-D-heptose 7-phosphate kinase/D-beta-D-heptose 1-phosphate adenosyltransferase